MIVYIIRNKTNKEYFRGANTWAKSNPKIYMQPGHVKTALHNLRGNPKKKNEDYEVETYDLVLNGAQSLWQFDPDNYITYVTAREIAGKV